MSPKISPVIRPHKAPLRAGRRTRTIVPILLIAALVLLVALSLRSAPDAQGTLLNPVSPVQSTDYVASGAEGLRTTGAGSVNVSGVSGPVTQALLFWHSLVVTAAPADVNAAVTFAGTPLPAPTSVPPAISAPASTAAKPTWRTSPPSSPATATTR
jgi:hypothetical protein